MAIKMASMARVVVFSGAKLPDPNPDMGVEDVRAFYAAEYPELATAVLNGPEAVGDKLRYTFERAIGPKG
jgi:PRTRC genetic system protein C